MGEEVEHSESCSHVCVRACAYLMIRSDERPQMPTGVISTCKPGQYPLPLLFPVKGTRRGSSGRLLKSAALLPYSNISKDAATLVVCGGAEFDC